MLTTTFYIDTTTGREIIRSTNSDLQIRIYQLENEPFKASQHMLTFYGEDHGSYLAFEAEDKHELLPELTAALTWYATYIDFPNTSFTINDPRTPFSMYVVR
jgi:hypothetical protein